MPQNKSSRAAARLNALMPILNHSQIDAAANVMDDPAFAHVVAESLCAAVESFCRQHEMFNVAAFRTFLVEFYAPTGQRQPWPEGVDSFVAVIASQVRVKHPLAGYCECIFRYHRAMFVVYELNERERRVVDEDRIKRVGEREAEACAVELQLKGCDMSKDDARATAQWVTCHISELDNVVDSLRERERIMGRQAA